MGLQHKTVLETPDFCGNEKVCFMQTQSSPNIRAEVQMYLGKREQKEIVLDRMHILVQNYVSCSFLYDLHVL